MWGYGAARGGLGSFRGTFGACCDLGGVAQWLTALPPPPTLCPLQQNVYSGYGTAAPYGTTGTYGAAPQQPPTPGQQSGLSQVSAVGGGGGGGGRDPPPQISDPFHFVPPPDSSLPSPVWTTPHPTTAPSPKCPPPPPLPSPPSPIPWAQGGLSPKEAGGALLSPAPLLPTPPIPTPRAPAPNPRRGSSCGTE